jgi:hypothetical protein
VTVDIIIIKLRNKHTHIFARTEVRWFDISGCQPDLDFGGVFKKAEEVSAQYVADLYANSIKAKASMIKKLRREEITENAT